MNWVTIVEWIPGKFNQVDTYPDEGIELLVTDGTHYDVAWYARSGDYKWIKTKLLEDTIEDFVAFKPTHWTYITPPKDKI